MIIRSAVGELRVNTHCKNDELINPESEACANPCACLLPGGAVYGESYQVEKLYECAVTVSVDAWVFGAL